MKGDTVVDYAELQLSPKRTRCDFVISGDGATAKLACGLLLKPLVSSLGTAQMQIARGNQVIRLEGHRKKSTWFTKGTSERFIQYVLKPEIIERIKTIEDELVHLEQVRCALATACEQNQDRFGVRNHTYLSPNGTQEAGSTKPIGDTQRSGQMVHTDKGCTTDTSKRELVEAMDARLRVLVDKQRTAFYRACDAGFDIDSTANLMKFARHFDAHRLIDACAQFLALSRKWTLPKAPVEVNQSHNGGHFLLSSGEEVKAAPIDLLPWSNGQKKIIRSRAVENTGEQHLDMNTGDFQTASAFNGSALDPLKRKGMTETVNTSSANGKQSYPLVRGSGLVDRSSLEALQSDRIGSPRTWNSSSIPSHSDSSRLSQDASQNVNNTVDACLTAIGEGKELQQDQAPVRRLSVQAAINLFESKKNGTVESPIRSHRLRVEDDKSELDKPLVRRESSTNQSSSREGVLQEERTTQDKKIERIVHEAGIATRNRDDTNKVILANDGLRLETEKQPLVISRKPAEVKAVLNELFADKQPLVISTKPAGAKGIHNKSFADMSMHTHATVRHSEPVHGLSTCLEAHEQEGKPAKDIAKNAKSTEGARGRENYSLPVDLNMQALMKMALSVSSIGKETVSENFYEQYSRVRDAKLRGENPTKKAEREAKLRSMQETYERRKAEMEERASRMTKKPHSQSEKGWVQKGGISGLQVKQQTKLAGSTATYRSALRQSSMLAKEKSMAPRTATVDT